MIDIRVVAVRDSRFRYGFKYKVNDEFEVVNNWIVTEKGEQVCQIGSTLFDVDFKIIDEKDYILSLNGKIHARGNLKYLNDIITELINRGLYNRDYYKFEIVKVEYLKGRF